MDCQVCTDKFTRVIRRPMVCLHCKGKICLRCFCTYLLTDGTKQECMLCNQPITIEYIYINTTKVFREQYKLKITNLEMIEERDKMGATKQIEDAKDALKKCRTSLAKQKKLKKDDRDLELYESLHDQIHELRVLLDIPENEVRIVTGSFLCPIVGCKGMVGYGKCGECERKICCACREPKNKGHECNPDTVETLKAIQNDVKPCPKCKIPIYKIDGCDQMFCIECKTAFSWRRGTIETRIIHNPHYFQWVRDTGGVLERQPGDDPCGERFERALNIIDQDDMLIEVVYIRRTLAEASDAIAKLRTKIFDGDHTNETKKKIRIRYVTNERAKGTEKAKMLWFNALRHRFAKIEHDKDLLCLLEMYKQATEDLILEQTYKPKVRNGLAMLLTHMNTQFREINLRHNSKCKYTLTLAEGFKLYGLI